MRPSTFAKLGAVVLVAAAVVVVIQLKQAEPEPAPDAQAAALAGAISIDQLDELGGAPPEADLGSVPDPAAAATGLPKLLDLGADKCIPCKKMAPILATLREEFAGQFDVVFIDVWKNRDMSAAYKLRMIPTQIFFDAAGHELFRHEGFYSRQDILGKWAALGYEFTAPEAAAGETKVIAYYFHWTVRCEGCLGIEKSSHEAMVEAFDDQLGDGRLEWHAHNMEQPEYEHFQEDFELSTSSLVLVRLEAGQVAEWKVLGRVWDLMETHEDLKDYVKAETGTYLAAAFDPE
jgi:thioredoxin 1